jgi:hypothetical protein
MFVVGVDDGSLISFAEFFLVGFSEVVKGGT